MTRTLLALAAVLAFAMPASAQTSFINEIHYDNDGGDVGEFVEFVVPTGTDVSGYQIDLYNGSSSQLSVYNTYTSVDFSAATMAGPKDIYTVLTPGIQNGAPDGVALSASGTLIQFLSYEGAFTAADGPAVGVTSTDIGVAEPGAIGESLQLSGTGDDYGDFGWQGPAAETPGAVNNGQVFGDAPTSVTTSATVGWRLLSTPTPLSVDDLAQINLVSGAGGYTTGTNCQVNAITNLFTGYLGDENANQNGGYVAPGEGATIERGAGFFWYFFGDTPGAGEPSSCDDSNMNTSTTQALPLVLNADGTSGLAAGGVTVTISDADDADGFYMLGNPYSSAYDVSAITAVEAGTANAVGLQAGVQLWDPEIGDYVVYTADGGGDTSAADTDDVSIWQGFFVERSGMDPGADVTFSFGGSGILSGVEGDGFVARQAAGSPLLSFQVTDGARTGAAAIVRFEADADAAWDRFDLSKLAPFASDFAQIGPVGQDRDGALVTKAVESLSADLNGSVEIPFAFATSVSEGTFTVSWPRVELPADWTATLTDLVTGASTDLLASGVYAFEHSASAPAERFIVTVASSVVSDEAGAQAFELSALAPNPTAGTARMTLAVEASEAVTVQVYDALGRLVATVLDDVVTAGAPRAISVPTASLSAGVYVVRVQGASFAETRRLTVTR